MTFTHYANNTHAVILDGTFPDRKKAGRALVPHG